MVKFIHRRLSFMKKEKDLDDSKIFSDELLKELHNKEEKNELGEIVLSLIDGEAKNINPLKEMPKSQMKLYGFSGAFNSVFFDSEEELIEWIKTHSTDFGNICVMDYLGTVAGRRDVIRLTYKNGKSVLYTACDEDGYAIYNEKRSIYKGEFVWEYNYGSISDEYAAFRDRGIVFENDVYGKIAERNKELMAMFKEFGPRVLTKKKSNDNKSK